MAAISLPPQKPQKEGILDKIFKAAQIAKVGFDAYSGVKSLEAAKLKAESEQKASALDMAAKEAELSNQKTGTITLKDLITSGRNYSMEKKPGLIPVNANLPGGTKEIYIDPKKPNEFNPEAFRTKAQIAEDVKPATVDERKAAGFASQAEAANRQLEEVMKKYDPAAVDQYINTKLSPIFKGGPIRTYEQVQRDFVAAVLRRESGANIPQPEFESEVKRYFPQPGDTAEVIQQKAASRARKIESLIGEAGKAYKQSSVPIVGSSVENIKTIVDPQSGKTIQVKQLPDGSFEEVK